MKNNAESYHIFVEWFGIMIVTTLYDLCRGRGLEALRRAWWNLFNQLEMLALQVWDGLVETDHMLSICYRV